MYLAIAALLCVFVYGEIKTLEDGYTKDALNDQITTLPGLDPDILAKYTMFSGYIDVYPSHNRSIFYWFVESLNKPTTDPVAVWTNGGPGCSGLGGMFTEQGPFRPLQNLSLYVDPYSWVNIANMIFIEAPAGVGFSYSDVSSDYNTDDNKTAIDNYHLIQGWLTKFPNFQSNDFYITSESYGGHYMPTLAQQIVIGNNAGGDPQVNFKGIFVGNPYTDPNENEIGTYDTWFGHQLVSQPAWQTWYQECKNGESGGAACAQARGVLNSEVGNNIDPYALDFPVCLSGTMKNKFWFLKEVVHGALKRPLPGLYQKILDSKKDLNIKFDNTDNYEFPYEPCESNWLTEWINQASVQEAIHAVPKHWRDCGGISYSVSSEQNPMEPTWKWLFAAAPDLHYTIISGDDDSVCGTMGTQSWVWDLGYTTSSSWQAWTDEDGQTGGWKVEFKGAMTLVTVHSAGHMIPETQPSRSLQTFKRYLSGEF